MGKLKNVLAMMLIGCMALGLTACGGGEGGIAGAAGDAASSAVDKVSKMLSARGREYDKLFTGEIGDTLTNSFFDFTVNSVTAAEELEGYTPTQEGYKFIVADITVKNIFDSEIPVGNYDFNIIWGDDSEDSGEDYSFTEFMDGMYPDEVDLAVGETLSGTLVFEVPADETNVGIVYYEIWDDDFLGNTYVVNVDLSEAGEA